jgi:hypothetical protein
MIPAAQMEPPNHIIGLVTSDKNKKFELAARMASAIVQIIHANGGCLPQDLNEKGFTPDEVIEHWHMAQSLAAVEINLAANKPHQPKALDKK